MKNDFENGMYATKADAYGIVEEILLISQETLFNLLIYFENDPLMLSTANEVIDKLDSLIYYSQECQDVLGSVDETA